MHYRALGGTGIEVSAFCLGTMMFGFAGNPDHGDCARIIRAALDRGINFVDTADMYSAGESEEITGKTLRGRRADVVLATSGFLSGRYRKGQPVSMSVGRPTLNPDRFDPALAANDAKFEAVEELVALAADIGCPLPSPSRWCIPLSPRSSSGRGPWCTWRACSRTPR
jgi:aryl-alcohol dehydrogenase-like predicted oxidoreductase